MKKSVNDRSGKGPSDMEQEVAGAVLMIRDSYGIDGMRDAIEMLTRELAAAEAAYAELRGSEI